MTALLIERLKDLGFKPDGDDEGEEYPDYIAYAGQHDLFSVKVSTHVYDWSKERGSFFRERERPTVSTPVTWDEVEACADPSELVFTSDDVLARVERNGDLFAPLLGPSAA